ncbi:MAG: RAMP superfamily CRISPR-associated protein [Armatimonadetes bacterium]|nr:RAMP superfamily CRISPR-associated protein [Armatimonadota bacterium]MDW8122430.1 RAMP superfamily CRISPR-associated protein [Armatimonadota bacterium]
MHKTLYNAFQMDFQITPKGPLLIKSGLMSPNPSLPDMQFVRTQTANGETVYIPGSSLKGVFRSFCERILRTNGKEACEPFPGHSCARDFTERDASWDIYKKSCLTCKIYGNTRLRGRLSFTDVLPNSPVQTEVRYGVAISRQKGSVAVGPFEMESVIAGSFRGSFILQNFETWQLGLIALTIDALNQGLVAIGFGKNRGFGQVTFCVQQFFVEMPKRCSIPSDQILGVGALMPQTDRQSYGLKAQDRITGVPPLKEQDRILFVRREYEGNQWREFARKAIQSLSLLEEPL